VNSNGKVAIVTGASMGIGRAISGILADEGYGVVCAARSAGAIAEAAEEIRRRGGTALAIPTDISDAEAVRAMTGRILAEFGRIDVLVNNAGGPLVGVRSIAPHTQEEFFNTMAQYTFDNISAEDFATIFAINFYGPLNCIRCVLPVMKRQGAGHIINISSKSGMMKYGVVPGMIAYGSAKAALTRFTEVLAFELVCCGSPIRINALSPGLVAVSFHENLPPEDKALFRQPEDIRMSLLKILDDDNPASGEVFTEDYTTWLEDLKRDT
jgi:NAD(P)-dependent dehydrogenase (short-subunit alcohol dehydrogenase family)